MKDKSKNPTKCPECGAFLNAFENRVYASDKQNQEHPLLYRALKEFDYFQIVSCPVCKNEFKNNSLRLFRILKPWHILFILAICAMAIIAWVIIIYPHH